MTVMSSIIKQHWRPRLLLLWFQEVALFLQSRRRRLFDPYRPESHYMRGPGPKWREKHRQTPHG